MFTKQMQELERLKGLGVSDQFVDILGQTIGNCAQPLEHRGPVELEVDGDQLGYPDRPVMPACGDIGATLRVRNEASGMKLLNQGDDNEHLSIFNGAALQTCGVVVSQASGWGNSQDIYNQISNINQGIWVQNIVRFGDENLWINGVWYGPFYKVKVTIDDTTPDYLGWKIAEGSLMEITIENVGANELLSFAVKQYNSPTDGYFATYHAATGAIEWVSGGPEDPGDPSGQECCLYPFTNRSGETIPPYAVMEVYEAYGSDTREILVRKPGADDNNLARQYAINGPNSVVDNAGDWCYLHDCMPWALIDYDDGDDLPRIGSSWGPKPGSWLLHRGYPGYRAYGNLVASEGTYRSLMTWAGLDELVGWTYSSIGAASGSDPTITFGTGGIVQVWAIDRLFEDNEVNGDSGWKVTAYSTAGAVAADNLVQIKTANGIYWVDVVNC